MRAAIRLWQIKDGRGIKQHLRKSLFVFIWWRALVLRQWCIHTAQNNSFSKQFAVMWWDLSCGRCFGGRAGVCPPPSRHTGAGVRGMQFTTVTMMANSWSWSRSLWPLRIWITTLWINLSHVVRFGLPGQFPSVGHLLSPSCLLNVLRWCRLLQGTRPDSADCSCCWQVHRRVQVRCKAASPRRPQKPPTRSLCNTFYPTGQ